MTDNLFKVPPKAARALSKIPEVIVEAQDPEVERKFHEDFVEQVFEPIEELLWPYANNKYLDLNIDSPTYDPRFPMSKYWSFRRHYLLEGLAQLIRIRIYLCASPEQFEIRWQQASDQLFSSAPELYAHAREDGTLLDEPIRVATADNFRIADDGTVTSWNYGYASRMPGESYPPLADRVLEPWHRWTSTSIASLKANNILAEDWLEERGGKNRSKAEELG